MIKVNEMIMKYDGRRSLDIILKEAGFDPRVVVVELNHVLIRRSDYKETFVEDNSFIEVFSFVGGG